MQFFLCTRTVLYMNELISSVQPYEVDPILHPFYRWGNWVPERLIKLLNNRGVVIWLLLGWIHSPCCWTTVLFCLSNRALIQTRIQDSTGQKGYTVKSLAWPVTPASQRLSMGSWVTFKNILYPYKHLCTYSYFPLFCHKWWHTIPCSTQFFFHLSICLLLVHKELPRK